MQFNSDIFLCPPRAPLLHIVQLLFCRPAFTLLCHSHSFHWRQARNCRTVRHRQETRRAPLLPGGRGVLSCLSLKQSSLRGRCKPGRELEGEIERGWKKILLRKILLQREVPLYRDRFSWQRGYPIDSVQVNYNRTWASEPCIYLQKPICYHRLWHGRKKIKSRKNVVDGTNSKAMLSCDRLRRGHKMKQICHNNRVGKWKILVLNTVRVCASRQSPMARAPAR